MQSRSGAQIVRPRRWRGEAAEAQRQLLWCLTVAAVLGLGVSSYLTWAHLARTAPLCALVDGCAAVQASAYSEVMGMPLALAGAAFFLLMAVLAGAIVRRRHAVVVAWFRSLAVAGGVVAVALVAVQAGLIHAFCSWCLAAEVLLAALAVGGSSLRL